MSTFNFSLHTGDSGPLVKSAQPDRLFIPIHNHTPVMGTGDQVLAGTLLATANQQGKGDLHAPLAGTITEITPHAIHLDVTGTDKTESQKPPKEGGAVLREWLRTNGVNVRSLNRVHTLIINAIPPEPGITIYAPLLRDYRKVLEVGLDALRRIIEPAKLFLVVAKGNRANAFANCSVLHVPPVYPNGLDPLVTKSVTGKEVLLGAQPENALVLSVKDLFFIGRTMETGRPVTETVMTIGTQNHLVPLGTPVGFLTAEAGATVQPNDKVILGGVMRGLAAVNMEQGVDKETSGLTIIQANDRSQTTDNFCLGCGECERHCPARIMPGMISRCAEFKQFERAESFHIHSCIECGLCGYWCTAQRPLLQYIRLAKYELALLSQPNGAKPENETTGEDAC